MRSSKFEARNPKQSQITEIQTDPHPPPNLPLEWGGRWPFPSPSEGGAGWVGRIQDEVRYKYGPISNGEKRF
jgi:hypothetical protein